MNIANDTAVIKEDRVFEDDTKWGRCVDRDVDKARFQMEIDSLTEWSHTWQLHFNTDKCKIMHLGRNNSKETYTMDGHVLETTRAEKQIGVMVQDDHPCIVPRLQPRQMECLVRRVGL